MKRLILCLVALCSGAALADTPLFDWSAPPQLRTQEAEMRDRLAATPGARVVGFFSLNRSAFISGTVTVSVNNKVYRFVGKVEKFDAAPDVRSWSGGNGNPADRLSFTEGEGGVFGHLDVDGHHFSIHGQKGAPAVLVIEHQHVPGLSIDIDPPANKAASRP